MLKNHGFWPFLILLWPKIDPFRWQILTDMNHMSFFHAKNVQNLSFKCPRDFLVIIWRLQAKVFHIKSSQICSTEPISWIFVGGGSYDRFWAILAHCGWPNFSIIRLWKPPETYLDRYKYSTGQAASGENVRYRRCSRYWVWRRGRNEYKNGGSAQPTFL